jgi:amylosucrase
MIVSNQNQSDPENRKVTDDAQDSRSNEQATAEQLTRPQLLDHVTAHTDEVTYHAALTLERTWPRVEAVFTQSLQSDLTDKDRESLLRKSADFVRRLDENWADLFAKLHGLYATRFDFHFHVESLLIAAAESLIERPEDLCELDRQREFNPTWYQSQDIVGGALYVDLFSGNLNRLRENIPYFEELGITYLHLMPLFAVREGNSDGGYAISDYRAVDPKLGTVWELKQLASELREVGIQLVLDFVFNHTSDDHDWAKQAQSGNREFQDYYFMFPDRKMPDAYERNLREIFPSVRRGNFTWDDGTGNWVWTTFNSFQWDLNYQNPAVFCSMLREMLFIANVGISALRLDAVAFIWKQLGTACENLPQAHEIIQAYNSFVRIVAPGLIFKSEAIVHPDDVVKYISTDECQISYNPTLMALLWESLATKEVKLLNQALSHRFDLPERTSWVNYLRCHDDIGWTFDDEDAAKVGINGYDHRQFLNRFYTGQFEGSFARGVPFQENAETGDMRVSGTLASLAGLEEAIAESDSQKVELSIARILLLQGVSMSIGGIPLLYLGEEWGMLNDYDFAKDPAKADDSRWIHRPKMDWDLLKTIQKDCSIPQSGVIDVDCIRAQIFESMKDLIALRKSTSAFTGQHMDLCDTGNDHVLGFARVNQGQRIVVLANFSDTQQLVDGNRLRTAGMGRFFVDLFSDRELGTSHKLTMEPYQLMWLKRI